MRIYNIKQPTS